jgi:hypothetical protein
VARSHADERSKAQTGSGTGPCPHDRGKSVGCVQYSVLVSAVPTELKLRVWLSSVQGIASLPNARLCNLTSETGNLVLGNGSWPPSFQAHLREEPSKAVSNPAAKRPAGIMDGPRNCRALPRSGFYLRLRPGCRFSID